MAEETDPLQPRPRRRQHPLGVVCSRLSNDRACVSKRKPVRDHRYNHPEHRPHMPRSGLIRLRFPIQLRYALYGQR